MNPSRINGFSIGDSVVLNPESHYNFRGKLGIIESFGSFEGYPFAKVRLDRFFSVKVFLKDLKKEKNRKVEN